MNIAQTKKLLCQRFEALLALIVDAKKKEKKEKKRDIKYKGNYSGFGRLYKVLMSY